MKQLISCILIIGFLLALVPVTHGFSPKTEGKVVLVAILSGIAILTRYLAKNDIHTRKELHNRLGTPERIIKFEHGFDCWQVEWYGDQQYFFRNGVLHKASKLRSQDCK